MNETFSYEFRQFGLEPFTVIDTYFNNHTMTRCILPNLSIKLHRLLIFFLTIINFKLNIYLRIKQIKLHAISYNVIIVIVNILMLIIFYMILLITQI